MAMTKLRYVIRDRVCIGFFLSAGRKSWKSYDEHGRSIGFFGNESDATRAVYEQDRNRRGASKVIRGAPVDHPRDC
jgi:hypothetical protein